MSGIDSAPTETMIRFAGDARRDHLLQGRRAIRDGELGAFAGGAEQGDAVAAVLHQLAAALHQQAHIGPESRGDRRGDGHDQAIARRKTLKAGSTPLLIDRLPAPIRCAL